MDGTYGHSGDNKNYMTVNVNLYNVDVSSTFVTTTNNALWFALEFTNGASHKTGADMVYCYLSPITTATQTAAPTTPVASSWACNDTITTDAAMTPQNDTTNNIRAVSSTRHYNNSVGRTNRVNYTITFTRDYNTGDSNDFVVTDGASFTMHYGFGYATTKSGIVLPATSNTASFQNGAFAVALEKVYSAAFLGLAAGLVAFGTVAATLF